jgi:hypothetical protein
MAKTRHSGVEHPSERGSALLGVLLMMMMMSALGAALAVNGHTETLISRNQRSATQATVAAEAGLNHAVELATTFISQWKANGFANVEAAVDALLLGPDGASGTAATDWDNGSLGTRTGISFLEELPSGTRMTITGGINAEYEAFIMDDDATAPDEPGGDLYDDENAALIVRSTGYSQDGTKVVLEALITPVEKGAVVVNGDLVVGGNATITGSEGRVHVNGDLTLDDNADVVVAATAGGLVIETGGHSQKATGPSTGGAPELSVPEVRASDYLAFADFVLTSAGTMTDQDGAELCSVAPCNNWDFNSGEWSIGTEAPVDGTYYVEGTVRITGSPGSAEDPLLISILAEGSIDISGSPTLRPDTPDLLFVTDGDLDISGNIDAGDPVTAAGQILVHEQVNLRGTPSLGGQLFVEDATSVDPSVTANDISGNVTLTYTGGLGSDTFGVTGWRDVRDAN